MKAVSKIILLLVLATTFFGCNRENMSGLVNQTLSSEDYSTASAEMDDADDQAAFKMEAPSMGDVGTLASGAGCPTLTWAAPKGTFPNTLTIDYGTGCQCGDKIKSGQIVIEMTADMLTAGAVRTVSLVNFKINENEIFGTKTVTNIGLNEAENLTFSVSVADAGVNFEDGTSVSFVSERLREMIEGSATEEHLDDVFSVTGTGSGVNRKGDQFTATILSPVVKAVACEFPQSGTIEMATSDHSRTLDFGDGTCDDLATVTNEAGKTREIQLKRCHQRRPM